MMTSMNFLTLPYNYVTISYPPEVWFWGPYLFVRCHSFQSFFSRESNSTITNVCLSVCPFVCLLSKPPAFIFHPSSFILTFATFKLFSLFLKASLLGKLSKFICKKHGIFHMLDFDPCLRNHTLIFFCDTL